MQKLATDLNGIQRFSEGMTTVVYEKTAQIINRSVWLPLNALYDLSMTE